MPIQGVNLLNYKLKQTSIISIEKVIELHWIAVAPYFQSLKRDHLFLAGKTLEISMKTFFFGDHLLAGKNLENSMKTFFFEITCVWPEKLYNTSKNAGIHKIGNPSDMSWPPGRRKKIWVNDTVFIWQGVNETKKVKNPCRRVIFTISDQKFSS